MGLPLTPIRCLHRAVDIHGTKVGVVSGGREFTYAEFGERCERLAAVLRRIGIEPGDRVAFLSFNNNALLEAYFGVPMARGVFLPLNARLSAPELSYILQHSGARFLFYESEFQPAVDAIVPGHCSALEKCWTIEEDYEHLLAGAHPVRVSIMDVDEHAPAELFYTSGSAGLPKGVVLSHRAVYLHGRSVASVFEDPDTMVDLQTIALFHANGWGHPHASTMLGIKQVLVRRFVPEDVLRLVQAHGATYMCLVPTMANALLNCPTLAGTNVSSMRNVLIGGAASAPELIARMERAFGCRVNASYGLTEAGPVVTVSSAGDGASGYERQAMAGWPIPNVEVRVADTSLIDVPKDRDTVGELLVRSEHLMTEYYRDPDATSAALVHGWLRTGDLAVWDSSGYVKIVDRKKDIIISGGENISSLEVEKALCAHPDVLECAVVAAPDDEWGEIPVAVVVRCDGSQISGDDLRAFLKGKLSRFKWPRVFEFVEEPLPKTGTGKIRKLALRERYWRGRSLHA